MRFQNGYILLLIPLAVYLIMRKRGSSPLKFSSAKLIKSTGTGLGIKRKIGKSIISLSAVLFIIALARPQTKAENQPIFEEGIDIGLVFDVSGSMASVDFEPNRLEVARETLLDFVDERSNDRLALVVLGGSAYTKVPLTLDHDMLKASINSITTDSVQEEGTAIGMALSVGINRLKKSEANSKVLILVTDGDNNAGAISPDTASELAKELGIKIYTIGVGTDVTILPYTVFGRTTYQQYEGGLDEALLQKIADTTGGSYYRATDKETLANIFEEINELEKSEFEENGYQEYNENGYLFMKLGLIALLLGIYFDRYRYIQIP